MAIKFNKDPLYVEQNNYLTKLVNVYIVYELDAWQKIERGCMSLNFLILKSSIPL